MKVHLKFEPPSDLIEEYVRDRSPVTFIRGPLGSGKTQATIIKLLMMCQEQSPNQLGVRPTRIFVIRNTYPDLLTTTIRDWSAITAHVAPIKMGHPPTQLLRFTMPDKTVAEIDVIFVALDREEHVRKLRGMQGTLAWLNEAKELPFAVVEMTDARLGRYPSRALAGVDCDHAGMIVGDTNAPDEDHWYAQREQDPPVGWRFFTQPGAVIKVDDEWIVSPGAENVQNLPPNYYQKLLQGKREEWIKVNLANEYGSAMDGKPVWPEFKPEIHVKEFDTQFDNPILFGMDFGLTPAMVLAQDYHGQLRIFDEIVTDDFSAEQMAEAAKMRKATDWPTLKWGHGWGDPANPRSQTDKNTPIQVMQANRFNIIRAPTNDFVLRRDAVGKRFMSLNTNGPSILIHPRCKALIKGCKGHYHYRRQKVAGDEKYHDVPDKNMWSHVCEALQYLCIGMGDGDLLVGGQGLDEYTDWEVPVNRQMRRRNAR